MSNLPRGDSAQVGLRLAEMRSVQDGNLLGHQGPAVGPKGQFLFHQYHSLMPQMVCYPPEDSGIVPPKPVTLDLI
jgi:hypothetical protein